MNNLCAQRRAPPRPRLQAVVGPHTTPARVRRRGISVSSRSVIEQMIASMVKRVDGRRFSLCPFTPSTPAARPKGAGAQEIKSTRSGWLTVTEAPETRIYFTNHRSPGSSTSSRARRSIVNRTTALWSIWIVASLILASLGMARWRPRRGSNGVGARRDGSKKTNINSGVV